MINHEIVLHDSRIIQGHRCFSEALAGFDWASFSSVFVVSQDVIWNHHGDRLLQALKPLAMNARHYLLPDGEAVKNLSVFGQLQHWLAEERADRKSVLIVLGGGVVGDLVGFVAATYMRGIRWIYLPTTLLAQQDASVGGKVAVNLAQGKNLVGRFWNPLGVIIDTLVLDTLPLRQVNAGYMELLKHGMLQGGELLERTVKIPSEVSDWSTHGELLWQGLQVKVKVVTQDPYENNQRRLLNLGHTFGHALESFTEYRVWLHGEAVGIGLMFAAALALELGGPYPWEELLGAIWPKLPALDLDSWDREKLLQLTQLDKKGVAGVVPWIVPFAPGRVEIVKGIDDRVLIAAYDRLIQRLEACG